jgi:ribosomal protein L17
VYNAVKEKDIEEVVQALVTKAKSGDMKAMQMLFDYVLGGKDQAMTQRHLVVHANAPSALDKPEREKRIPSLYARAKRGLPLDGDLEE